MSSHCQNSTFQPEDFKAKGSYQKIHPSGFIIDSRMSFERELQPLNKIDFFTDGSKLELHRKQNGFTYCVFQNGNTTHQWLGKLREKNSVFQAEQINPNKFC
ncbi:hypothetical protein AVEN_177986-1 [Araneus ventricosus]|uniref:Uncharacterized protein n=1 Tax=Araneus ventricosus TaxID=182803 RepID=A0A4Y2EHZ2_ARAVE|nr:hypothetical protein AVEN_177986-1 [Araneus ventricosus]